MTPNRLSLVTPAVLTLNEESNIQRTLQSLRWAARVVVVDSGSTDETVAIARGFANVDLVQRPFDTAAAQWSFATARAGVGSRYVLALDADMSVTSAFLAELETRFLAGSHAGGLVPITWCYSGRALVRSFCPPQLRIYRPEVVSIRQYGHTQEFCVSGSVYQFRHGVLHDDRKSFERWLSSQAAYSRLEAARLRAGSRLRIRDRIRRTGCMPFVALALAYVRAGGPFGGRRALRYALERTTYESLLAIRLMEGQGPPTDGPHGTSGIPQTQRG